MSDAGYDIIERLIRNISHEIKNPLTTIRGYAQMLGMKPCEPDFIEKTRKMVIDNVDLIDERMNALYDVFGLEPGNPVNTDLASVLNAVVGQLDPAIAQRISLDATGAPREVGIDPGQLTRALGLILNGFCWENFPSADARILADRSGEGKGVAVRILFGGVDFSDMGSGSFYLPFSGKKHFRRGTELFEVFAMSEKNGWRFDIASGEGRRGFLLVI